MKASMRDNGCWQLALNLRMDRRIRRLLAQPGGGGIATWNRTVGDLWDWGLLNAVWREDEPVPPLVVSIWADGLVCARMRLDNLDLRHCALRDVDFAGARLRGARFGSCEGCCFSRADLRGADFASADVSGCEFDQAIMDETTAFKGAVYDRDNPPRSLERIDECRPLDWSVPPAGRPGRQPFVRLAAEVTLKDLARLIPQAPDENPPV